MDAWKKYQVPLFILGVAVFVFALRSGKPLGKNHNQTFSGKQNSTADIFVEKDASRLGIPKIDPANDPLAHRASKRSAVKPPRPENSSASQTVYEFPESSPILAQ
jgi:hypothetical protein